MKLLFNEEDLLFLLKLCNALIAEGGDEESFLPLTFFPCPLLKHGVLQSAAAVSSRQIISALPSRCHSGGWQYSVNSRDVKGESKRELLNKNDVKCSFLDKKTSKYEFSQKPVSLTFSFCRIQNALNSWTQLCFSLRYAAAALNYWFLIQETQKACFIFLEVASYQVAPNAEERVFWKSLCSFGVAEAVCPKKFLLWRAIFWL